MGVRAVARPEGPQLSGSKQVHWPKFADKNGAPSVPTMAIFQPLTTHGELQSFPRGTISSFPSSLVHGMARKVYLTLMAMSLNFVIQQFCSKTM